MSATSSTQTQEGIVRTAGTQNKLKYVTGSLLAAAAAAAAAVVVVVVVVVVAAAANSRHFAQFNSHLQNTFLYPAVYPHLSAAHWMTVKDEFTTIWKKTVVACFKTLYGQVPGRPEETAGRTVGAVTAAGGFFGLSHYDSPYIPSSLPWSFKEVFLPKSYPPPVLPHTELHSSRQLATSKNKMNSTHDVIHCDVIS